MQNTKFILLAVAFVAASAPLSANSILIDSFDDLSIGALTRGPGNTLRGDGSGPSYNIVGSTQTGVDAATLTVVDTAGIGGNFSGNALQFNFSANSRFLYIPFSSPGWNDGDKLKATFDFAYSADPTDNGTSVWMSMHNQRDLMASGSDFLTSSAIFQDDSGHSLKVGEKTAGSLTGGQYGFTNARMTSSSGNFHNGPAGLDAFIQSTSPVRISFELERVANAFEFEGEPVSGTLLSLYVDDVWIDTAPVTALVVGGEYSAFTLWARGTGTIDNLSLTYTAVPEPSTFAILAGLIALGGAVLRRRISA